MEFNATKLIGMSISVIILVISIFFLDSKLFFMLIGIAVIIGVSPFVFSTMREKKIADEKEKMFLEFARNLVESVKAGTPVSKSIINVKDKPYGLLTPNIRKLANQISLGIPLRTALQTFSHDVGNKTVARALTLIGQAEKAGGNIGEILESVAGAVNMTDKLKKERKSTISNLVVQGYIIFFIFIAIIIVMQFRILPMMAGIANIETFGAIEGVGDEGLDFSQAFLYLLLIQGFFNGLSIGMLSEGSLKPGIKHSFVMMISAFIISSSANLLIGG